MSKGASVFVCQACGASHARWNGRCDACGAWNSLVEETAAPPLAAGARKAPRKPGAGLDFSALDGPESPPPRRMTGIAEFDRVLGGGLVPGGAALVGGDPGIGKSTLLLQAAAALASSGASVAYITGEEAIDQIRDRARRLGLSAAPVALAAETALRVILDGLKRERPDVVIIDSVQTLWSDMLDAAPGSVAQVRACAQELVRFAKKTGASILLVGHVTKDGQIAGPRVVEHLVDAVFYFEGERGRHFRILRGVKNRYGATDEIGVFEMTSAGLSGAHDPAQLFLSAERGASGAAVTAALEGSRPILIEIEALAGPQASGSARRSVVGWDSARLAMMLAVLETRCGQAFSGRDVYCSVAGGYRLNDPAADLAAAAALLSSGFDAPLAADAVFLGEIGLSGAVRPPPRLDLRLREAARLGFKKAYAPPPLKRGHETDIEGLTVVEIERLSDLVDVLAPSAPG